MPGQGETDTALQEFKGGRDCRQLTDAVTMEVEAEETSELHPERGTGFDSAETRWHDALMRESINKDPEELEEHARHHRQGHFAQNTGLIRRVEVNDLRKEICSHFLGCCNKLPQTGGFRDHKCIILPFWREEA